MKREKNEGGEAGLVEKWRPRGQPSSLENGEEGAALGSHRDPDLKHVGGQNLREGPVAQAQAVKVVTANTTAASALAADGGHAR
jgi:hypothetical protein